MSPVHSRCPGGVCQGVHVTSYVLLGVLNVLVVFPRGVPDVLMVSLGVCVCGGGVLVSQCVPGAFWGVPGGGPGEWIVRYVPGRGSWEIPSVTGVSLEGS